MREFHRSRDSDWIANWTERISRGDSSIYGISISVLYHDSIVRFVKICDGDFSSALVFVILLANI